MCCSSDIFLGFLAILFPPLPVWVKSGLCSADSLINILLCLLGFIPGLLHAWYIIAKHPEPDYTYSRIPENPEAGHRVTYIVVSPQPTPAPSSAPKPYNHHAQTQHHQHHQQQQQRRRRQQQQQHQQRIAPRRRQRRRPAPVPGGCRRPQGADSVDA
jgi:uncharacterized membrane protein YqaE (UPF0057 family)